VEVCESTRYDCREKRISIFENLGQNKQIKILIFSVMSYINLEHLTGKSNNLKTMKRVALFILLLALAVLVCASKQRVKLVLRRNLVKIAPRQRFIDQESVEVKPAVRINPRGRPFGKARFQVESDVRTYKQAIEKLIRPMVRKQISYKNPFENESDFERNTGYGHFRPHNRHNVMLFQDRRKIQSQSDQYTFEMPPSRQPPVRVAKNTNSPFADQYYVEVPPAKPAPIRVLKNLNSPFSY
jgi:hypothetical protein